MTTDRTKVTAKGQVVIPKHLRDRKRLHIGDRVSIENQERAVRVVKRSSWAQATAGCLASSRPPLEPEEVDELMDSAALEEARDEWGAPG